MGPPHEGSIPVMMKLNDLKSVDKCTRRMLKSLREIAALVIIYLTYRVTNSLVHNN